jgi:hypothetical protein
VSRYITWTRRLDVFVYFLQREISSLAAMWDAHWKIQPYGLTSAIGTCKLIQDDARVCNIPIGVGLLEIWGQHDSLGNHVDPHKVFDNSRMSETGAHVTQPWYGLTLIPKF